MLWQQRGSGLLEQLLALAIVSTVMLGLLSLQQQLVRQQQWLWQRDAVLWLSRGLLEGAELAGAASYRYRAGSAATAVSDCHRRACSPAQLAAHDLGHWQRAVRRMMPAAELRVSGGAGNYRLSVVYFGIDGRPERLELGR